MRRTTVGVDEFRVYKADFEVMQHSRLVEVAERRQVILSHQDVRVPQVGEVLSLGVQLVLNILEENVSIEQFSRGTEDVSMEGGFDTPPPDHVYCLLLSGVSPHKGPV